ncbi:MAG: hypothetical protein LBS81_01945 [Endomicrobium sp.]|nr:hypothetical protein [Endomicrobium sp.]
MFGTGTGNSKKEARRSAARQAIKNINHLADFITKRGVLW